MNILVIGEQLHLEECMAKFGAQHTYVLEKGHQEAERFISHQDVTFDFLIDQFPAQMEIYRDHPSALAFLNTVNTTLLELVVSFSNPIRSTLFGFNGLPTFLNREILEVSLLDESTAPVLTDLCAKLTTPFLIVADRVGMVTPRVVCMIINEAYYTLQEGTASKEDIDLGMKLGTNYPYGPFEWCHRIGIRHVYELLNAVYKDTHDERYKICPLLKKAYFQALR